MTTSSRKQHLDAYQKQMNLSTTSLGNVNAPKTPTKFRASFSSVKNMGASALKAVLTSSKQDAPNSPTASASDSSIVEDDARSDVPSSSKRRQSLKKPGTKANDTDSKNSKSSRKASPTGSSAATKSTRSNTKDEGSKTKKPRRNTLTAAMSSASSTRASRRASCPGADVAPVDLTEFVQLDKTKRRETLAALEPQQVEHLFVESSRKLLAKKTALQKQLDDLQSQHASELRRLQEQLVDANMRLKQRELVHAQRQVDQQSSLQKEHQRLHKAMVAAQTNYQKQATELETRSLTLMEQVEEMKEKIERIEEYEDAVDEANYFSFQMMILLALGVAAVWAPAYVCESGSSPSLTHLPFMWMYGA